MFRPFKTLQEIWEGFDDKAGSRLFMVIILTTGHIISALLFVVFWGLRAIVGFCYLNAMFLVGRRHITMGPVLHPMSRLLRGIDRKFCDSGRWGKAESYFFLTTKNARPRPLAHKIIMAPFVWLTVAMTILLII